MYVCTRTRVYEKKRDKLTIDKLKNMHMYKKRQKHGLKTGAYMYSCGATLLHMCNSTSNII